MGVTMSDDFNYHRIQLGKLLNDGKIDEYGISIQIRANDKATKWLTLNKELMKELKEFFKKHGGKNEN